mgnify:CR=1 FL=1
MKDNALKIIDEDENKENNNQNELIEEEFKNEEENKTFEFLEDTTIRLFEAESIDLLKTKELMNVQTYREYFLSYLNSVRKEGLIYLKKNSF